MGRACRKPLLRGATQSGYPDLTKRVRCAKYDIPPIAYRALRVSNLFEAGVISLDDMDYHHYLLVEAVATEKRRLREEAEAAA